MGVFTELLWTHNAPVEKVGDIFQSRVLRVTEGNGLSFRYGLDNEYGEIKFVMKLGRAAAKFKYVMCIFV